MENFIKKIIILAGLLVFSFFKVETLEKQAIFAEPINYSSPAIQTAVNFLTALTDEDYEKAWGFLAKFTQNTFENIDIFKEWCRERFFFLNTELIGQINATPNRVVVRISFHIENLPDFGFYIVKINDEWKIDFARNYFKKIEEDMEELNKAIKKYYRDNHTLPENLLKLINPIPYIKEIPSDPFNEQGGSYVYMPSGNKWKIYSLGSDGDDDLGLKELNSKRKLFGDGDIITTGEVSESD